LANWHLQVIPNYDLRVTICVISVLGVSGWPGPVRSVGLLIHSLLRCTTKNTAFRALYRQGSIVETGCARMIGQAQDK